MTIPDPIGTASRFRPLTPDSDRRTDGTVLVSYITLRRVVGFLGVGLPIIVAIVGFVVMGFWRFEPTISDYYRIESARNAFEGILFTIAWFLFTYRGFDRGDELTGEFACRLRASGRDRPVHRRLPGSQSTTTWPPAGSSSR